MCAAVWDLAVPEPVQTMRREMEQQMVSKMLEEEGETDRGR